MPTLAPEVIHFCENNLFDGEVVSPDLRRSLFTGIIWPYQRLTFGLINIDSRTTILYDEYLEHRFEKHNILFSLVYICFKF